MKLKLLFFTLFFAVIVTAQELKATVVVNYDKITNVNSQIFKSLEKQFSDFLNNTKFTEKETKMNERIPCSFFLFINSFNSNEFEATMQITSSRPVFNSNYTSPVLNLNDKEVSFRYIESENFVFDQNSFTSNLLSIGAFYANIIIGSDADTFSNKGGTDYFQKALNIANVAQSSGYAGWVQTGKKQNRFNLISDLMSNTFDAYREAMYFYHLKGLDVMALDVKQGKQGIIQSIDILYQVHKVRPNSLLARTFFDAKTDEIVSIFTGGPVVDLTVLTENLKSISPLNGSKWNKIR